MERRSERWTPGSVNETSRFSVFCVEAIRASADRACYQIADWSAEEFIVYPSNVMRCNVDGHPCRSV